MGSSLSPEDQRTKAHVTLLSTLVRRMHGRQWKVVPHPGPIQAEQRMGGKSGALRAAIFGANDGLVSNLSLIMGVAGAAVANRYIVVAGIAGLLAGAFSMGAGEYISVRVQREVFERLIHLEAHEIGSDAEAERQELSLIYQRKGISKDLAERLSVEVMRDPEMALETHAREELGLDPQEGLGSPWAASSSSFATFSIGALIPLIPFLFASGTAAVITAAVLSLVALFAIGGGMSFLTGRPIAVSGARMMLIGGAAALITYSVGRVLNVTTGV